MKPVTGILMDLVSIPSVSSMSNRPVIDYVTGHLDPAVWTLRRFEYLDPSGVPKTNLVAATGTSPELAIVCHTDTVPFDPAWREAVHPVIRDGKLYGRGSADVKGFLACALAALPASGPPAGIALVLTADEEIGCIGAKHLVARNAIRARRMLIGEPTNLTPVVAGKGYGLGEIVVRGEEAHSAFPGRGRSAIRDAARVIERLDRVAEQLSQQQDAAFDPPFTTLNAGLIQGGSAKNIIPGKCSLTVEWRPIPGQDPAWAAELIAEQLALLESECPGLDAKLHLVRADRGFCTKAQGLSGMLESLSGHPSGAVAFGTEASHLGQRAEETVVFGPGDMTVAHKSGEYVAVEQLEQCVDILKETILRSCSS